MRQPNRNRAQRTAWIAGLCFLLLVGLRYSFMPAISNAAQPVSAAVQNESPISLPNGRLLPIYSVETNERIVALGFNAAWSADDVPTLLQALGGEPATFFVLGEWAQQYPDAVAAIAAAGHEVMSHGYDHTDMTGMPESALLASVEQADAAIEAITQKPVDLMRMPSGAYDAKVLEVLYQSGHYPIQWSIDTLDWKGLSADEMTDRVLQQLHPGAIILLHVGGDATPQALPSLLAGIRDAGYRCLPVGELILRKGFALDHTGRQYPVTTNAQE